MLTTDPLMGSVAEMQTATRLIFLSDRDDSKFVTVDAEDYVWLSQWKWSFRFDKHGKKVYAMRNTRINNQQVTLYMHVEILKRYSNRPSAKRRIGDHIDGDSTNNRKSNLRWATPRENALNRRKK